ncbi:MAG: 16S rRNA (cytosine(1402)-N(4))-methyltransferase RsmH [Candidatus Pacebacteria bacterium]|nr:16S rRNA (cytosine(1402)-N(4))-methyltransferase RsmH [Candidatus Paceibacterota bacterium]
MAHIPVLLKETINYLNVQPKRNFIDATAGEGGHSFAILRRNGLEGKVLSLEIDKEIYSKLKDEASELFEKDFLLSQRLILVNDSYANLKKVIEANKFKPVAGILFDLGICSWQIDDSQRGFSYLKDEPLDMRFNKNQELTAAEIINFWEVGELEEIFREYGEEKYSKRLALAIKEARRKERIVTTGRLLEILKKNLPKNYDKGRKHFAARTFQALRIAVNNELENLKSGLRQSWEILEPEGRIVIISFHSLEDRIVKIFFKEKAKEKKLKILTKKPIVPQEEEIKANPRAHSAKLRAAEKS